MKRAYIVICWEMYGVNTFTGEQVEAGYCYSVEWLKAGENIKSRIERKNRAERRARAGQ